MQLPQKSRHRLAFMLALGISSAIFLPFIVDGSGYFIYYGDFNVQQIPFYRLAHEAVRSGDIFWSWHTDLGANFIGSYSFYLLFSPFFWLTLPFPVSFVPYMMAPLLVLKTAFAAMTACIYLTRFVKDPGYAVIGGLLYAFSGWMTTNIFFNHFHEPAVFFPLLLIGVEKLVWDGKKGYLAAAVFINALVNYWFFIGQAVFVVIYFVLRMTDRGFRLRMSAIRFMQLAFEAVLGVCCAAVALLPSAMALRGNPRTGPDSLLTGQWLWLYWNEQKIPAVIHSMFFPPELTGYPNFFPDNGAKWASLSAWLPMIGMAGVLAYFFGRRYDWLKKLLAVCLVIALVPGLNSMFVLLNHSYYARWFYMPVLLMALASVRALEDCRYDTLPFRRAFKWCAAVIAVFIAICAFTPILDYYGGLSFGLAEDMKLFWFFTAIAAAGLILTATLVLGLRGHSRFQGFMSGAVALFAVLYSVSHITYGKDIGMSWHTPDERAKFVINTAIRGKDHTYLPDTPFARADAYDAMDNLLMFWNLPNIQAFHSIVPPSIMEFYPVMGVKRDVSSKPETEFYALRPLLSVRWLFIHSGKYEQEPMPGYRGHSQQAGFNVYENENFIPMGFAYDAFTDIYELEEFPPQYRGNVLLKAVALSEEAIRRNKDLLSPLDIHSFVASDEELAMDCAARREYSAYSFERDRLGFTARTNFDRPKLLFFSVPWEEGWSASVNGEAAYIERANIGFMAVRVPAGESLIRFDYMTPGLVGGIKISIAGVIVLAVYLLIGIRGREKGKRQPVDARAAIQAGETVRLTEQEYREQFDSKAKGVNLQRALNEGAARHMASELSPPERTLRFDEHKAVDDD